MLFRSPAGGSTKFARTVEDLPVGKHEFRISAIRNDSTLARSRVSAVLRRQEVVDVSVFPNPFSGPPNLSVTLPKVQDNEPEVQDDEQSVTIRVFDILGRHVATPIRDGTIQASRSKSFTLGPVRSLASGVYFFRVRGEDFVETTKAVRTR